MPRNSVGVWAFGPAITRFVPPGYHPEAAGEGPAHGAALLAGVAAEVYRDEGGDAPPGRACCRLG